jgi:glutamyl-tRNA synthetase
MFAAVPRRFRFAPTPSRPIHAGSALAALVGWASARAAGGHFVLRIEDIDHTRCRPEHEASLLEDLRWLGLDWDEGPDVGGPYAPYRQRERADLHDAALRKLIDRGLAYACTCSRNDIRGALSAPHLHATAHGEIPYPGTCRGRGQALPADGARGGYRLDIGAIGGGTVHTWRECNELHMCEDVATTCGDFLLGRPQQPTYQLAVVVDDIAMGITDIVRGRDLLGSTARQALLRDALGAPHPRHCHHPLLLGHDGLKLSKRDEAPPLALIRAHAPDPSPLIAALGRAIGLFHPGIRRAHPTDVAAAMDACNGRPPAWHDARWPPPDEDDVSTQRG